MLRKSPYLHQVKSHTRQGKQIDTYERGKGDPLRTRSRPKTVVGKGGTKPLGAKGEYTVSLYYSGFDFENFEIESSDFEEAMHQGFAKSRSPEFPEKVKVRCVQ